MTLEPRLREQIATQSILLMTHIVVGYPSLAGSLEMVDAMVEAGVGLIEMQIPFSEPIADGPVIVHANQVALAQGTTVDQAFNFAHQVSQRYPIPFLFMTYANLLMRPGVPNFVARMQQAGLSGAIVPDLPPEEGQPYVACMREHGLDPIFIFAPTTPLERLKLIAESASGFVYCVARKGVTGAPTQFSSELSKYLARCRAATSLPLAVGFGIRTPEDVQSLVGQADIAVVGSETLRVVEESGMAGVAEFVRKLLNR